MKIRVYANKPTEYWSETKQKFVPIVGSLVDLKEEGFLELNAEPKTKSRRLLDTPLAI